MKIISEPTPIDIPSHEMRDGQVAVLTKWGPHNTYVGKVVKRYGNSLVSLASTDGKGNGWPDWFEADACLDKCADNPYRVRILKSGTTLEI